MRARDQSSIFSIGGKFRPDYELLLEFLCALVPSITCAGENFRELVESKICTKKNFAKCSLVLPKDTTPPNLAEKTFANSHKTLKLVKVFSLKSFPLYSIKPLLIGYHMVLVITCIYTAKSA